MAIDYGTVVNNSSDFYILGSTPPPTTYPIVDSVYFLDPKLITVDNEFILSRNTNHVFKRSMDGGYEESLVSLPSEVVGKNIIGTPGQSIDGQYICLPLSSNDNHLELSYIRYDSVSKSFEYLDSYLFDLDLINTVADPRINVGVSPDGLNIVVSIPTNPGTSRLVSFWMDGTTFGAVRYSEVIGGNRDLRVYWPNGDCSGDIDERTFYLTGGYFVAITIGETELDPVYISNTPAGSSLTNGSSNYTSSNNHGNIIGHGLDTYVVIPALRDYSGVPSTGTFCLVRIDINKGKVTSNGQNVFLTNTVTELVDTSLIQNNTTTKTFLQSPYHYSGLRSIYVVSNGLFVFTGNESDVWTTAYTTPLGSTSSAHLVTNITIIPDPEPTSRRRTCSNWWGTRFIQT